MNTLNALNTLNTLNMFKHSQKIYETILTGHRLYNHEKFTLYYRSYPGDQLVTGRVCLPCGRRCHTHYYCDSGYPAVAEFGQWRFQAQQRALVVVFKYQPL
jgi:hypothetical protein